MYNKIRDIYMNKKAPLIKGVYSMKVSGFDVKNII